MKLALCNEVLADRPFAAQCVHAAALGYGGLEVAPYTLGDEPHLLPAAARREIRQAAETAGLVVSGLHWLLVKPEGLSVTSADAAVRGRTREVLVGLVRLCAEIGGAVLVHGSPAQRRLPDGPAAAEARGWAGDLFAAVAEEAETCGVTYCLEPLAPPMANFVTTVAEAAAIVDAIGSPNFRTMIDTGAARANPDEEPLEALIARWLPSGHVTHIQFRDRTRRGPGQGDDPFAGVLAALEEQNYVGWIAVEPIELIPDGPATAAFCAGYLKGLREGR